MTDGIGDDTKSSFPLLSAVSTWNVYAYFLLRTNPDEKILYTFLYILFTVLGYINLLTVLQINLHRNGFMLSVPLAKISPAHRKAN